jgi:predicted nucleotidyltransferase
MSINYFEVNLAKVIEISKSILNKNPKIIIAVIFGSAIMRKLVRDIDIGYIAIPKLSFEEYVSISTEIEERIGILVDFIPLDESSPLLRYIALSKGIKIIVKNYFLFYNYLSEALMELNDLDIKWRMVKENKI